ncbi:host attachment protein [Sphingopyxis sp. XHP0097]|jgi:protein required for attachment to host cells|uniref:Host attachment protein n=1 Tax=Sphingopyxis jiangsuensis TaxID=2871171 RepID=A0ABS7MD71_9SPHN|nr:MULTISPECIES: host attachment protein [Sphingopyxis]MBL0767385.1 host attachment protein [Sphingopyxis lutea]MBY4636955.1 host attachment protein [Sphingopyxis jiangsuensis]
MHLPHGTHVAVADGNRFVMFRNDGDALLINLVDPATPDISTSNRGGANPEVRDLDERGHAAGVAELLNSRVLANEIDKLLVIADPLTLGVMREHYHGELEKRLVGEIAKTMTNVDTRKIEQAIAAA